jgi:hypothetical protein
MKITNKYGMPPIYVEAITRKFYKSPLDRDRERTSIGVTTLIDSPWIYFLRRKHEEEMEMDVMDAFFAFRGSMVHQILESVRMPNVVKELYLQVKHESGLNLSGVLDLWDMKEKSMDDYKVKSVNSAFYYNAFDQLNNEHQCNIYRWMFYMASGVVPIETLNIRRIFFDWVQRSAQNDANYPQSPHKVYEIKVWPLPEIADYINERMLIHTMTENIPICSPEERWQKQKTWALMKAGNKRATKVYREPTTLPEGYDAKIYSIEEREGEDTRCVAYCNVNRWCPYYNDTYKSKE